MIVETGHFALVLALAIAIVQAAAPALARLSGEDAFLRVAAPAALVQFALVALAFAALTHAHVVSDFSVANVIEHSHSLKPLLYKVSGVWGNHEGSMLLWVLILALFGALFALASRAMPERLAADALGAQGLLSVAFLLFILFTSNPFARVFPPPPEGADLNPTLQDIGLAIHPPLLYVGYVGFSIVFSLAAAALIGGRVDARFARLARPWVLLAWIFLTLGIAMGSYWAYYELGWGGFWFWDPVENSSLMPWLSGTALLHSAIVMERREALKVWTIFLAILTFSLSLLGAFLVRSGVLTSVHAFANDPARGIFILVILIVFIGGALALFAWRAPLLKQGGLFAPISREGALVLNNLLLTACCATVFVGTLYPLALEAVTGDRISVGAPFFDLTFGPLFAPLLLAVPFGPCLAWKRGDLLAAAQRLALAALLGFVALAAALAWRGDAPLVPVLGIGTAVFVIVGAASDVAARAWRGGASPGLALRRAAGLPLSTFGSAFAHAGLGVTLLGLAATGWGAETIADARVGEALRVGPYTAIARGVADVAGPNYRARIVRLDVARDGVVVARVAPEKRFYPARQAPTTEAGIATLGLGQFYATAADIGADGSLSLRLYWKPLVTLIWIGALIMGLGGALSLADRRLRIGAARRAPALEAAR